MFKNPHASFTVTWGFLKKSDGFGRFRKAAGGSFSCESTRVPCAFCVPYSFLRTNRPCTLPRRPEPHTDPGTRMICLPCDLYLFRPDKVYPPAEKMFFAFAPHHGIPTVSPLPLRRAVPYTDPRQGTRGLSGHPPMTFRHDYEQEGRTGTSKMTATFSKLGTAKVAIPDDADTYMSADGE